MLRQIREEYESGSSMKSLSQKYCVSFYSVESWCGLRPEVNRRQQFSIKRRRPRTKEENSEVRFVQRSEKVEVILCLAAHGRENLSENLNYR